MKPTKFLITIDTEVYPIDSDWKARSLAGDIARDIYGKTSQGAFGVAYQLEIFARYGLKAVFFVEGLHASSPYVGLGPLTDVIGLIRSYGQEIQLHLHPEWIPHLSDYPVPDRGGLLTLYSEDEQRRLLETAANNLIRAGAPSPVAFRAGDYAANRATLRALASLGFRFDTSYNYPYLGSSCQIEIDKLLWQPEVVDGIWEVPVSCFQDYPRHYRHCQLGACSGGEILASLRNAVISQWQTYVLVSHSFELINNRWSGRPVGPRTLVIRRFEELCESLAALTENVLTAGFSDLTLTQSTGARPIRGNPGSYLWRNVEQAIEVIRARTA